MWLRGAPERATLIEDRRESVSLSEGSEKTPLRPHAQKKAAVLRVLAHVSHGSLPWGSRSTFREGIQEVVSLQRF